MRNFKDLNIIIEQKSFVGDKIKIDRILNREIVVLDFKIEKTKIQGKTGDCLYLQISVGETKHVVFSGAAALIEAIRKVPKEAFPFTTIIVKENERLQFT